jgi:epoxyqueuosine reductase QueG
VNSLPDKSSGKIAAIKNKLTDMLRSNGVYDVGFTKVEDGLNGFNYAISIVVPLSDAIIDEIDKAPTHTYYNHYRTVNAFIDRMELMTGLILQREGYRYIMVAASQSISDGSIRTHMGRYSHKKVATLAGLGTIGKSSLFIHKRFGPRVRLGSIFTDCPLSDTASSVISTCGGCEMCVKACPAHAITGTEWHEGIERSEIFDANLCNNYMRENFMKIGRGSVCGICIKVCRQN